MGDQIADEEEGGEGGDGPDLDGGEFEELAGFV